jgi:hemerythrin-like domain-containing protein
MSDVPRPTRRNMIHGAAAVAASAGFIAPAALLLGGCATDSRHASATADTTAAGKHDEGEEDVTPPEDLMREHGVLKRIMLVYDEVLRRMQAKQDFPPDALADAAGMVRSFVEDYHEKLEEDYLFPRFEKANKLVELVKVLRAQHQAGRRVTDVVLQRANASALRDSDNVARVTTAMREFNRMYAPHEAREDTVLFPAFRSLVSANEYASLGEDFEKKENQLFGHEGFERMVDKVGGIEKKLGIYDLAQFTPKSA